MSGPVAPRARIPPSDPPPHPSRHQLPERQPVRASYAVRAIGAVTIPAVALPLAAAAASAPAAAAAPAAPAKIPPPPTRSLPSALDIAEPYVGQTTCDPTAKPYVVRFGDLLRNHYASVTTSSYGIGRNCNSGVTEHSEGRALD